MFCPRPHGCLLYPSNPINPRYRMLSAHKGRPLLPFLYNHHFSRASHWNTAGLKSSRAMHSFLQIPYMMTSLQHDSNCKQHQFMLSPLHLAIYHPSKPHPSPLQPRLVPATAASSPFTAAATVATKAPTSAEGPPSCSACSLFLAFTTWAPPCDVMNVFFWAWGFVT